MYSLPDPLKKLALKFGIELFFDKHHKNFSNIFGKVFVGVREKSQITIHFLEATIKIIYQLYNVLND